MARKAEQNGGDALSSDVPIPNLAAAEPFDDSEAHTTRHSFSKLALAKRADLAPPTPEEAPNRPTIARERPADSDIPRLYDDETEVTGTDRTAALSPLWVRTKEQPTLLILAGKGAGSLHKLTKERTIVGRGRDADVVIEDAGISRHHCELVKRAERRFVLRDMDSTNGTLLNGKRVVQEELSAGDRAQLGPNVVLQFDFTDEVEDRLVSSMYEAATRDALTKAFNRRYLLERMASEISFGGRHKIPLSFVILDVDNFKKFNDTYGHAAGDEMLKAIAGCVQRVTRPEDVFTRYGGEEFALLARGTRIDRAIRMAERVRVAVEAMQVPFEGHTLRATVSLGAAELVECNDRDGTALIALADERLYRAKMQGRNRVVGR